MLRIVITSVVVCTLMLAPLVSYDNSETMLGCTITKSSSTKSEEPIPDESLSFSCSPLAAEGLSVEIKGGAARGLILYPLGPHPTDDGDGSSGDEMGMCPESGETDSDRLSPGESELKLYVRLGTGIGEVEVDLRFFPKKSWLKNLSNSILSFWFLLSSLISKSLSALDVPGGILGSNVLAFI